VIENRTLLQAKTVHSFMVGKQHYSPPEQTREGETLDARADIYALGAVFYRALAGKPPADTEERARKIAFGEGDSLIPLSIAAPHVPAEFAKAIEKALSFRAAERQASIAEFREALRWQGTTGASSPTTPVIRDLPRPAPTPSYIAASAGQTGQKKRMMGGGRWAALAAVLVVAVIGGAFAMTSLRNGNQQVAVVQPAKVEIPAKTETPQMQAPAQNPQQVAVVEPRTDIRPETKIETPVVPVPPVDPQAEARRDFEIAQKVDTMEAYDIFLSRHPEGFYATLARAQKTKLAALDQQRTQKELTRNLITELQRVGCGPDTNDGEWNDATRKSLDLFNRHAKTKLDVSSPNQDALDALRGKQGRVCPLVCRPGFQARGNECVAIPQQVQQRPQQQYQQPRQQQQQQQQQQQAPVNLPRGVICVRGICVGN
jgi:hypothetical protein